LSAVFCGVIVETPARGLRVDAPRGEPRRIAANALGSLKRRFIRAFSGGLAPVDACMQNRSLRRILGQPALHILVALGFAVAFAWPILVLTQPRQTFHFLYAAWFLAIVASFALSRGQPSEQIRDTRGRGHARDDRNARGTEEAR